MKHHIQKLDDVRVCMSVSSYLMYLVISINFKRMKFFNLLKGDVGYRAEKYIFYFTWA